MTSQDSHRDGVVNGEITLSPLAGTLRAAVTSSRGTRIAMERLRQAALAADLSLAGSPDGRARLAEALDELHRHGMITLPKTDSAWDHLPRPPLPRWVARPPAARTSPTPERVIGWHATLSWVPAFLATEKPTPAERSLLRAVNAFLAAGASAVVVPLRERSLQVTGDEKTLDTMSRGRLFTPERLTLQLLRARRASPPLVRSRVGSGPVTLLVENYATYDSLVTALPSDASVGEVVYSAGNTLGVVLVALAEAERPAALAYFGDLDVRGLEIAAAGAQLAAELALPQLKPAEALYRLLLEHGRPATVESLPQAGRVRAAVEWLPDQVRPYALDVLLSGRRLAQEAVGLEVLLRMRQGHMLGA